MSHDKSASKSPFGSVDLPNIDNLAAAADEMKNLLPISDDLKARYGKTEFATFMIGRESTHFAMGDHRAPFRALQWCRHYDLPVPVWVQDAIIDGFRRAAEAGDYDQGFGPWRRKGERAETERKLWLRQREVFAVVSRLRGGGLDAGERPERAIDRSLFEDAAEELGIGRRQVEESYYRMKKYLDLRARAFAVRRKIQE